MMRTVVRRDRRRSIDARVVVVAIVAGTSASALNADRPPDERRVDSSATHAVDTSRELDAPAKQDVQGAAVAGPVVGPDVIVSQIDGVSNYTSSGAVDNLHAYAFGTTACNIGDAEAVWESDTNQHPVIALSLFRRLNNRFEQIGQSWLKHGFCAVNGTNLCEVCQPTDPVCPMLGIGCSDTYSEVLNGNPIYLGPKSEVNAATGAFPYPHPSPTGPANLRGRLLAQEDDVDPALNENARYFVQAQYVTPDEPGWGTHLNNCSYRRAVFDASDLTMSLQGPTTAQEPAILKWAALDDSVEVDVIDIPGDGRVYLASRVQQTGPATWSYEYALFNMNSERSIGWFRLPIEAGAAVSEIGFHDVEYHSGEPYSGDDWAVLESYSAVTWATEPFAENENANALRWGTLYNFRLVSDVGPMEGEIVLGLFNPAAPTEGGKGGAGASLTVAAQVPGVIDVPCVGDIVTSATFNPPPDGVIDGADLASLLSWWGAHPGSPADLVDSSSFAPPPDGLVDGADLAYLLGAWGNCE